MNFSSTVARRITGVSYRQIDYWDRRNILRPSVMGADGSGSKRQYSETDLLAMLVLGRLAAALGTFPRAMVGMAKHLQTRHDLPAPHEVLDLVVPGEDGITIRIAVGSYAQELLRRIDSLHAGALS